MKKKLYELTDEHRAQLDPWAKKWIANALSTKAMDDTDREAMIVALNGMYDAANLPRPKNIVFVPSPLVLALAGTISAGVWHLRKNPDFARALLFGGKKIPTDAATRAATDAATRAATAAATRAATYAATAAATDAATRAATADATDDATDAATADATDDATRAARQPLSAGARWLMGLCKRWGWMTNSGNMWSGWTAYLSFFRHVAKLDLPVYKKFQHYESATIHGGYRMLHAEFAIVSDRPEILKMDGQNRPHCADGPSHRWRDGWSLYHYHGIRVPAWIIECKHEITPQKIDAETNSEIRRCMIELYGAGRYLLMSGAEVVSRDDFGILYRKQVDGEPILSVRVLNSTPEPDGTLPAADALKTFGQPRWWRDSFATGKFKEYFLDVHPELRPLLDNGELGDPQALTPRNAVASTFGLRGEEYAPLFES